MRIRFWIELISAIITFLSFIITMIIPNWIEFAFHIDPDQNNGVFEKLIVIALFAFTVILCSSVFYELKRVKII